ncbi:MAG TPA: hypothetical protein VHX60_03500 [Acidobacteriaceae bacterium]|jgi:hypothetical protein|nr:hypothetical protein [Acidobacteriaceae bacterium]
MTHRRTKLSIAIVIVVLLLLAGAIYLRKEAPPEAARLLPESDGMVYVNLRPLRAATHFDQHPVTHDPEYQRFIDATGINVERDLDEAAFALHRMANPNGPNGGVAFSEAFVGHFDGRKLAQYLAGVAAGQETYAGRTIYDIPSEGRTVRVALLGYDIVAVSNTPSSEQIHSMIDRYRTSALPFSGSSLLSKYYSRIPLLSVAWGIGQIGAPLKNGGARVMGIRVPLDPDSTLIASLSWIGKMHLRVEEIAPTESGAADTTESLQTILVLLRSMENSDAAKPFDADMRGLLNSISVDRHRNEAVLTATVPTAMVQRILNAQDLRVTPARAGEQQPGSAAKAPGKKPEAPVKKP